MSQLDGSLSSIIRLAGGGAQQSPLFNMQAGQLYRATVEQVNAGSVLLRIGELSLRATTDVKVVPGQSLLLKVNRSTEPPTLEVVRVLPLPDQHPPGRQASTPGEEVNQRIQALVSRQASPLMLFTLLAGLDPTRYPPQLASLLASVQAHMLQPGQLTDPQQLHLSVGSSGIWLEAILKTMIMDPAQAVHLQDDLKVALLKLRSRRLDSEGGGLAQLLDEGLASTLSQVCDGVLARMSLHQVQSVLQAEQGHLHWSIDLPVRLGDQAVMVAMTLRREHGLDENGNQNTAQQSWQIELETDLERLGAIRVSLFLREQQLSVALESNREKTVELLARTMLGLEEQLREQGFAVDTLLSRPLPERKIHCGESWYENLIEVSV